MNHPAFSRKMRPQNQIISINSFLCPKINSISPSMNDHFFYKSYLLTRSNALK